MARKMEQSIALNNIGNVYYKLSNFEKAIGYYNRALQLKRESGDDYDLGRLLVNLGWCYSNLSMPAKGKKYSMECLSMCAPNCTENVKLEAWICIGYSFFKESNFEVARDTLAKAYELSSHLGDKRNLLESIVQLVNIPEII